MIIVFDMNQNMTVDKMKESPGGETTYILSLNHLLHKHKHEVHNLLITNNPEKYKSDLENITIIKLDKTNDFKGFIKKNIFDYKLYNNLRKEIINFNPDIIHFQSIDFIKTVLISSRGYTKIQTFHSISSVFQFFDLFYMLDKNTDYNGEIDKRLHTNFRMKYRTIIIDHIILNNNRLLKIFVNKIICPSKDLYLRCKKYGFKNIYHLPYYQQINKNKLGKQDYFLYVGRLNKFKGVDYLLNSFKIAIRNNHDLKLLIIGEGEEKKSLMDKMIRLKLQNNVKFIGHINNEDLNQYYQNALAVIIPSIYPEVSPLVAYESMNNSKPIIAFDNGGIKELIIQNETGWIIKDNNINELAKKIIYLSKNKSKAKYMGINAKKYLINNFSEKDHIKALTKIYSMK